MECHLRIRLLVVGMRLSWLLSLDESCFGITHIYTHPFYIAMFGPLNHDMVRWRVSIKVEIEQETDTQTAPL